MSLYFSSLENARRGLLDPEVLSDFRFRPNTHLDVDDVSEVRRLTLEIRCPNLTRDRIDRTRGKRIPYSYPKPSCPKPWPPHGGHLLDLEAPEQFTVKKPKYIKPSLLLVLDVNEAIKRTKGSIRAVFLALSYVPFDRPLLDRVDSAIETSWMFRSGRTQPRRATVWTTK